MRITGNQEKLLTIFATALCFFNTFAPINNVIKKVNEK